MIILVTMNSGIYRLALRSHFVRLGFYPRGVSSKVSLDDSKPASTNPSNLPKTHSFAMNMFRGILNTDEILPFPKALSHQQSQQLSEMIEPLDKFIQTEVDSSKADHEGKFDPTVLSKLAEFGAYGLQVPEELQGSGLSNTEYARLVNIIGTYDLALAVHLGAHQSIGYKGILLFGTKEQKEKYLPRLVSGKSCAAYCLTEPGSGSDVSSIQTKADLSSDGRHYILNGTKIWISNGGLADIFTVFAKTPVKQSDGTIKSKITAFIVDRAFGGLTNSEPEKKMGINASNTVTIYLDNCKVPVENVLGEVGDGFKIAVRILNQGRFGMAAALSGTMRAAIRQTAEHVIQRKQFGRTLNQFENVQEKITTMAMRQYATEPNSNHQLECTSIINNSKALLNYLHLLFISARSDNDPSINATYSRA